MKVLHILDHSLPIHSGYSFRSAEIMAAQAAMGFSVLAVTGPKHWQKSADDGQVGDMSYERAKFLNDFLPRFPVVVQGEVIRSLYTKVSNLLRRGKFDLIHAHSPALNGIAGLLAARGKPVPVVYEMRALWEDAAVDHGVTREGAVRYRVGRALETKVFHGADAITTICEGLRQEILSRGIDESKVTIIPNAVNPDLFAYQPERRQQIRRDFGLEGRFVIAFCGSFYSYEGLDLLVSAVRDLSRNMPNVVLLLAGGGEQEAKLRQAASDLISKNVVRFLGRVARNRVVEIYNFCDVCVFPRRRMKLTEMVTPLKPLEAMASGGVVLASDVGGHKELIHHGRTGFLFEAGSESALISALARIAGSTKLDGIRASAREFIVKERTWTASARRYTGVYERAIESRSRA